MNNTRSTRPLVSSKLLLAGAPAIVGIIPALLSQHSPGDARDARLGVEPQPAAGAPTIVGAAAPEPIAAKHVEEPLINHPLIVLAFNLRNQAQAQGGLEMGTAAFHQFPCESFSNSFSIGVLFSPRNNDGTSTGAIAGIQVDVRAEKILTAGVVDTNIVSSGSMYDVQVRFNASIPFYAEEKQKAREWALSNGRKPMDEGVALIHNNFIYNEFTYGEIATAAATGQWVTVVHGTSFAEATVIANSLHP